MAKKSKKVPQFQMNYGDKFVQYESKEWAIHSAECYASFFGAIVKVVDLLTEEPIATAIPNETGIGARIVRY